MLATGLGPVLAPQIGSWVLSFTTWRGVFLVLAGFGVDSAGERVVAGPGDAAASSVGRPGASGPPWRPWSRSAATGSSSGYALACGLGMSGTFAYVAGSSFVLQNVYGLSPQIYGLVFALNASVWSAGPRSTADWPPVSGRQCS